MSCKTSHAATVAETLGGRQTESDTILQAGNKLLISHRRLFEKDEARCFVGEVLAYENGAAKVRGYSFVRDMMKGNFIRKDDLRTKILSITSGAFLVYQLDNEVDVDAVRFESEHGELLMTDGKKLKMNMAEFPHGGKF